MIRLMTRLATIALLVATAAHVALAQPSDTAPPAREPAGAPGAPAIDDDALRERLERRLVETRAASQRLEAALAQLDAGDDARSVARELGREFARDAMEGRGARRPNMPGRDGGRGFRPWRDRPSAAEPLDADERARVLAMIERGMPETAERLARLRETDPEAADAMLARLAPTLRNLLDRFGDGPVGEARLAEFRAGRDIAEAGRHLRGLIRSNASPADIAAAEADLAQRIERGYDARLAVAAAEIAELEARVASLRARLSSARENRDEEINARVDELTTRVREDAADAGGKPSVERGRRGGRGGN